jgi:methionyl-tRNA formyltransferase
MGLRIVFMGTSPFAIPTLTEIIGHGHEIVAVYTRPPALAGRGLTLTPSPIQTLAEGFGLPIFHPKTLRDTEIQNAFKAHNADVGVVVAYGLLLPAPILEAPCEGFLNLHPSILPRWRGAAPVQRAIMAGDTETAVAILRMDETLDGGPVALSEPVSIPPNITGGELSEQLARLGANLMVRALSALGAHTLSWTSQSEEGATYAHKITPQDAVFSWDESAKQIHNRVRALSPTPGAFFALHTARGQESVRVLRTQVIDNPTHAPPGTFLGDDRIACGKGALQLISVQRPGRKPLPGEEFMRGLHSIKPGSTLATL